MHFIVLIAVFTLLMASVSYAADAADEYVDTAVFAIDKFIADQKEAGKINTKQEGWKTKLPKPPKATFNKEVDYFWVMETNKGTMKIKLLADVAPMHVSSTIYLARLGFYDNLTFHRVITSFMAQGGCPLGRGTGGPGYQYEGEYDKKVRHNKPNLLSMANAGPGTDGSQFFLTFVPTDWLDDKHTIFGEVVDGADVVKKLEAAGSRDGTPKEPLSIKKTTILVVEKKK